MIQVHRIKLARTVCAACCCGLISACAPGSPLSSTPTSPADAAPGTCWNKTETPAVIETISERVLISPVEVGADGVIRTPAQYKTRKSPQIVQPRQENWYQIVCRDDMTTDFTASLQRALTARGFYVAAITGKLDRTTRDAIAAFQSSQDLPGSVLTIAAAKQLGLVAVVRS
ncbi:peptidoglycan-binding domain-containing protein [Roseobacter sp.]|uniref:peptidoglycan-binding domain-containing protein n=1 Tax=Roseobacter sp. TaxID=1907202 RepID=UPI00385EAA3D